MDERMERTLEDGLDTCIAMDNARVQDLRQRSDLPCGTLKERTITGAPQTHRGRHDLFNKDMHALGSCAPQTKRETR